MTRFRYLNRFLIHYRNHRFHSRYQSHHYRSLSRRYRFLNLNLNLSQNRYHCSRYHRSRCRRSRYLLLCLHYCHHFPIRNFHLLLLWDYFWLLNENLRRFHYRRKGRTQEVPPLR
jgi:hypothetical protein